MSRLTGAIKSKNTNLALQIIRGRDRLAWQECVSEYISTNKKALSQRMRDKLGLLPDRHRPWGPYYGYRLTDFENLNYFERQIFPKNEQWNAYQLAAAYGDLEVLKELCENVSGYYSRTVDDALLFAIHNKHFVMVQYLLTFTNFAHLSNCRSFYGECNYEVCSPLQIAVYRGYDLEMVNLLLRNSASPNQLSSFDRTSSCTLFNKVPLHVNAYINEDVLSLPNFYVTNGTVLFYAVYYNDDKATDLISLLLEKGADPTRVTTYDGQKYTPLSLAKSQKKFALANLIEGHIANKTPTIYANISQTVEYNRAKAKF